MNRNRFCYGLLVLFLMSVFAPSVARAQTKSKIGGWKSYVTHRKMLGAAWRDGVVFALSNVGFVEYHVFTGEYFEYTRLNGLSGVTPISIAYDSLHDYVFIGYADGLVDYFRDPKQIYTIRDIYLSKNIFDKKIYQITNDERYVYFATSFGIVAYDIDKRETRYTYAKIGDNDLYKPVLNMAFFNERIYAAMQDGGLYSAPRSSPNLADGSVWQKESGLRGLPAVKPTMLCANNKHIYTHDDVGYIYYFTPEQNVWKKLPFQPPTTFLLRDIKSDGDSVYMVGLRQIWYGNADTVKRLKIYENCTPLSITLSNSAERYVITDEILGMHIYDYKRDLVYYYDKFTIWNNLCQDIAVGNNELYIAPAGYSNNYAPAGNPDGFYYYNANTNQWTVRSLANHNLDSTRANVNFGALNYHRASGRVFASAYDQGVLVLKNGAPQQIYDAQNKDCFTGIYTDSIGTPFAIRVLETEVDDATGVIWMAVNGSNEPITAIAPDGKCFTYNCPAGKSVLQLEIDDNGYKWVSIRGEGIYVFSEGNTLGGPVKGKTLRDATGKGNLASMAVTCLRKDLDGSMWVGTNTGVSVFYNTYAVLNSDNQFDAVCPIFNGRCLLKEDYVNCIAVDGANRKWIGTRSSGVYLVSADGTQEVFHFTTQNSPLISDNIISIEIEQTTGEVFIATENGLVSYLGSATEGLAEGADLYVFPNPVYSDFDGVITLRGSVANAVVRIVTASGELVRELRSDGGQTIWDGKNAAGNKVVTGVYLALVSDEDGKNAGIAKIAFIKRP